MKLSLDAGAHKVEELDHTCQEWHSCYRLSCIEEIVKKNGDTMVPANNKKYYKTVSLPKGKFLKKTKIHDTLIKSDVWFNVPTLKHHGGASMSASKRVWFLTLF